MTSGPSAPAGRIVHFDGVRWSTVASGTTSDLLSVWGASAHDAWIGGLGDSLLHLSDGGWVAVAPPASRQRRSRHVRHRRQRRLGGGRTPRGQRQQVGARHALERHTWADALVTEPFPAAEGVIRFDSVWASSPTDVWVGGFVNRRGAAATFGNMIHFDGTAWAAAALSDEQLAGRPITSIFGASATDVWAAPGLHWDGANGRPSSRSGRRTSSRFTAAPPTTSSAWAATAASSTSTARPGKTGTPP